MHITELSTGKEYHFNVDVETIRDNMSQGVSNMTFPNQEAEEGSFMRFSGQERDINFQFFMRDDGEDRSNGTHADEVITPQEQKEYLFNEIFLADSGASWELNDELFFNNGVEVALSDLDITIESTSPLEFIASIEFLVGGNLMGE